MAHFGLLSYRGSGHLYPLLALSRRLVANGHRVTVFQDEDLEEIVHQNGLEFCPVPVTSTKAVSKSFTDNRRQSLVSWVNETRFKLRRIDEDMRGFLNAYPTAIKDTDVDALLIGEISLAGPTVAEILRLPYFIISITIPHNLGWKATPTIDPRTSWRDRLQKELLEISVLHMGGPIRHRLDHYRALAGLGSVRRIGESFPELAHITQWPQCLDIPRHALPSNFYYTGPFIDFEKRPAIEFPWDRLDGRSIVYVSLGTTRKGDPALFVKIAEACEELNLQAVITLGGSRECASLPLLPGNAIVVDRAPQLDLLRLADLVITHAGSNTVLETLTQGIPMLAFPMTLDQPAVAATLARLGVAEVLSLRNCSICQIRDRLARLQNNPLYRQAAKALQVKIRAHDRLSEAVGIIEDRLAAQTSSQEPGNRMTCH